MQKNSPGILVVYRSKYGSAEQYARWIAEETGAAVRDGRTVKAKELSNYDIIVYGGSLYAAGILGFSLIRKNYDRLREKKVIVFSVGASPARPEAVEDVLSHNFTDAMRERVPFFHLRGRFDFAGLHAVDRVLMILLKKKMEGRRPEERTDDEKGMLAAYARPVDFVRRAAIAPVVECIRREAGGDS